MNPIVAFVVVMAVWTVSEFVARKTKSLLSSLFVASLIFLVGFLSGIFPEDLLASSSLLALAGVVVGFIIVHLGTVISLDDFKKQWKTFLIGFSTVIGIGIALWVAGLIFGGRISGAAEDGYAQALDFVVAGTGALSGGTISVIIVQEAALGVALTSIAVFPVLIAALQGLVGFPLTSLILRKEAARLRDEYRAGNLEAPAPPDEQAAVVFGVAGIVGFSALVGKLVGYSIPMSVAIGLTSLYGFPGTMILSQEAAKGAGESPEEVAAIENSILPKMIVAGFSTVTITSVIITSIIAGRIGV